MKNIKELLLNLFLFGLVFIMPTCVRAYEREEKNKNGDEVYRDYG